MLGGISGYFGGGIDTVIQRIIEFLVHSDDSALDGTRRRLPADWSVVQVYFAITIIISLIGWTELARVVRGRFISLKQEDFVMAAELVGCSKARIIFRHMVPSFISHIIAATTLAIPAIIISETSLSFLGLGLRPPAISWGVLLQDAQNIQALVISPWLLLPSLAVIVAVLAFNFMGDGIRDAADPYSIADSAATQNWRHTELPLRVTELQTNEPSLVESEDQFFPGRGHDQAVDGASFDVSPGKTLGIVGESGCGKSVTAQSILRIVDRPGRIVEGEIVLTRARWVARSISSSSRPTAGRCVRFAGETSASSFRSP